MVYKKNDKDILSLNYLKNRTRCLSYSNNYYKENRERYIGYHQQYYLKYREYFIERNRTYFEKNKDRISQMAQKRYIKRIKIKKEIIKEVRDKKPKEKPIIIPKIEIKKHIIEDEYIILYFY